MLTKLKTIKIKALKENDNLTKDAINSVLASLDTQRGRGVEINESKIFDVIKTEIKVYKEVQSNNKEYLKESLEKAKILEQLLPKQLDENELLSIFKTQTNITTPKEFMAFLDSSGYLGRYNKGLAARIVLKK